jgi:ketosteroid isomerase-like protein
MLTDLHAASDQWYRAWLEKDAATVERLAADDYLYVSPSGLMMDRSAVLAVIRSPSYRLDHATRSDVVVRSVGQNAAILRHQFQGAGSYQGKPFADDNRCLMVWEKTAGQWRLVLDQCSFSGM